MLMPAHKHTDLTLPLPELVRLAKLVSEVAFDVLNGVKETDWSPEEAIYTYRLVAAPKPHRGSHQPEISVPLPYAKDMFELLELLVADFEAGKSPSKRLLRRLCTKFESLPREALDPDFPEDDIWSRLGIISRA